MRTSLDELYTLIALAVILVLVGDTLLNVHPWGNIVSTVVLLIACFRIGQSKS